MGEAAPSLDPSRARIDWTVLEANVIFIGTKNPAGGRVVGELVWVLGGFRLMAPLGRIQSGHSALHDGLVMVKLGLQLAENASLAQFRFH